MHTFTIFTMAVNERILIIRVRILMFNALESNLMGLRNCKITRRKNSMKHTFTILKTDINYMSWLPNQTSKLFKYTKQTVAFSPQANYTDWATATGRRNLVPTFVDRGVSRGQRGGSPRVVNLSFLDRFKYTVFPISSCHSNMNPMQTYKLIKCVLVFANTCQI
jgi:hypothetical protein